MAVAKVFDLTVSQGINADGTMYQYVISVRYGASGEKRLSQTVTQRSEAEEYSPDT